LRHEWGGIRPHPVVSPKATLSLAHGRSVWRKGDAPKKKDLAFHDVIRNLFTPSGKNEEKKEGV